MNSEFICSELFESMLLTSFLLIIFVFLVETGIGSGLKLGVCPVGLKTIFMCSKIFVDKFEVFVAEIGN